jgi:hypothetical protein
LIRGAHEEVKAFYAPTEELLKTVCAGAEVRYGGAGALTVRVSDAEQGCGGRKTRWARIWEHARAARAALPKAFRVTKPWVGKAPGMGTTEYFGFTVEVR